MKIFTTPKYKVMIGLNYTVVPSTAAEDYNKDKSSWKDGKYVAVDEGAYVTLYVGHHTETREEETPDGETHAVTETKAVPIRLAKPVSRDAAINAAEMYAYSLLTPMDVASFNASLARKHRANPADTEVIAHDEYIEWVKAQLTDIGIV